MTGWLSAYKLPMNESPELATHFSFNGYKLCVPNKLNLEFLKAYTTQVAEGNSLFFVERKTPIFRMHFDMDFINMEDDPEPDIELYARLCTAVFKTFFPKCTDTKRFTCMILSSPKVAHRLVETEDEIEGQMGVKWGYHLIWPFLYMDQIEALWLRASVIMECKTQFGERAAPRNAYSDVIDASVLLKNGMRMIFSDKCVKCKACSVAGTRDGQTCDVCDRRRVVPAKRVCVLRTFLDPDGNVDVNRNNSAKESLYDLIRVSSIRTSRKTISDGIVHPPFAPAPTEVEEVRKLTRKSGDKEFRDVSASGATFADTVEIGKTTRMFEMVEAHIRSLGEQWSGVEIAKLSLKESSGSYFAKTKGRGSSFCLNVGRDHTSSTIFFQITVDGVVQRCFSKKDGSCSETCRKFASQKTPLPTLLRSALFTSTSTIDTNEQRQHSQQHAYADVLGDLHAIDKKRKRDMEKINEDVERQDMIRKASKLSTECRGTIQKALGIKTKAPKRGDQPHPVFPDLTCAEVDKLSWSEVFKRDIARSEEIKNTTMEVRREAFKDKKEPETVKKSKTKSKKKTK